MDAADLCQSSTTFSQKLPFQKLVKSISRSWIEPMILESYCAQRVSKHEINHSFLLTVQVDGSSWIRGYRALYNDILLTGTRRFVVTAVDPESQAQLRLAQAGVVFYLDDLKEVSETWRKKSPNSFQNISDYIIYNSRMILWLHFASVQIARRC